jgi:thermostable 8-oxoguanine DNA glycosylase
VLDTHVLKWLREQGVADVPSTTPAGRKYAALEAEFLNRVPPGMTPAAFDLEVWKRYAKTDIGNASAHPEPAAAAR